MTTRIDGELARPGLRVRGAWVVLAVATLLKAASAAWLGWLAWKAAVTMAALGGMLHASPRPGLALVRDLGGAGVLAALAFVFGLIVAAVQLRMLDRRLRPAVPGWIMRSAVAAASAFAVWAIVVRVWNRVGDFPGEGLAIAQFVACAIGEGVAMFAVQRRLLGARSAGGSLAGGDDAGAARTASSSARP
jgi:hypothetical protein